MRVDTNREQETLLSILGGSDAPSVSGEEKFLEANAYYLKTRYFDAKVLAEEIAREEEHPLAWVLRLDLDSRGFAKLNHVNKSLCERKVKAEIEDIEELAYTSASKVAQYYLALCYQHAWGVKSQDLGEAVRLFKLSAAQGYARASNNLGMCYQYGDGVEKDEKKAAQLYKVSADQGDAWAQYNLGMCYMDGIGVEKDKAEAARLIELSADQGYKEAIHSLADCYRDKDGQGYDKRCAYQVRRFGSAMGLYAYASDDLLSTAPSKKILLYKLSVHEKPETIYAVANKYAHGEGVDKDEKFAKELYEEAAAGGHEEAQKALDALDKEGAAHVV